MDKLSQTNQINRELTARELEYQKHIRQMTQHNNNQNNQETTKDDHQNNQLEQFKLERSLISLPMKIKNQKQGKSLFSRLDPSYFDDKKVRYISYLNSIYHSEWVLLYLKKLSNASLEMPNLHYSVSLPPVYAPWFQNDVTNYDCIVVDLPFCLDSKVSIKTNKPIFFIYRYPTIGQPKLLLKKKNQDKGKLNPSINLVINSNMASHLSNQEKQIRVWRVLPELEIKNIATPLNPKQIHMALIITDAYYTANLDNLLNFWKNHMSDNKNIRLHLGVAAPLSDKIQILINTFEIKNINIYSSSNIFGTLIYRCQYYFSLGYDLDLYAVWASQHQKKLIMMKYGEFQNYPNMIPIPYELGQQRICPELFLDHQNCQDTFCRHYEHQIINQVPVVKEIQLKKLLNELK